MPCDFYSCFHNGTCMNVTYANGTLGANCSCQAGYGGSQCEIVTAVDLCKIDYYPTIQNDTGPCMNNGTCTSLFMDYSCSCISGFAGRNCSDRVCPAGSGASCKHNSTCYVNTTGQIACACSMPYTTGQYCDIVDGRWTSLTKRSTLQ